MRGNRMQSAGISCYYNNQTTTATSGFIGQVKTAASLKCTVDAHTFERNANRLTLAANWPARQCELAQTNPFSAAPLAAT